MEDEMDQYDASGKSVHLLLNKLEDSQVEGEKKRVPVGVVRIVTAKNKVSLFFTMGRDYPEDHITVRSSDAWRFSNHIDHTDSARSWL
jgi:hypothetical protein